MLFIGTHWYITGRWRFCNESLFAVPDYLTFSDRRAKSTLSSKFPLCIRYASGKFSGKQRISLFANFPLHVNEGKLVHKEIFCLPLNFPLAYHMHEGHLEDKGSISLLHEQWGKYEVYIPWENKRIRGDHGIIMIIFSIYTRCQ